MDIWNASFSKKGFSAEKKILEHRWTGIDLEFTKLLKLS